MLVDFGLAKCLDEPDQQNLTQTAAILGSSSYMSPEQCSGRKDIDERSDIYSLACVMLEALCGKAPFQGDSALDTMYKQLNFLPEQIIELKEIPEPISKIILKALQKDKTKRYLRVSELKRDLINCANSKDTLQRRWTLATDSSRKKKFTPAFIALAAIMLLFAVALNHFKPMAKPTSSGIILSNQQKHMLQPANQAHLPPHAKELEGVIHDYRTQLGPQEAFEILKRWQREFGSSADLDDRKRVLIMFVRVHAELRHPDEAALYERKIIEAQMPQDACEGAAIILEMYKAMGQYKKGIALVNQLLGSKNIDISREKLLSLLSRTGDCYYLMHDYKNAYVSYMKAEHIAEEFPDASANTQWRCNLLACMYLTKQTSGEGVLVNEYISAAVASLKKFPAALAEAYFNLGSTYQAVGESEKCKQEFDHCYAEYEKPGHSRYSTSDKMTFAEMFYRVGRYKESLTASIQVFNELGSWSLPAKILCLKSLSSAAMKDSKSALKYALESKEQVEQALRTSSVLTPAETSSSIDVIGNYCKMLHDYGQSEKIVPELSSLVELVQKRFNTSALLPRLYLLESRDLTDSGNNFVKALTLVDKAIKLSDTPAYLMSADTAMLELPALAHLLKAELLIQQTKIDEGNAQAEKAVKLYEDFPSIKHLKLPALLSFCDFLVRNQHMLVAKRWIGCLESAQRESFTRWDLPYAADLERVADLRLATSDFVGAEKLLRECRTGLESAHFTEDAYVHFEIKDADALRALQRYDEAMALLKRSIPICEKMEGELFNNLVFSYYIAAVINAEQKRLSEALQFINDGLDLEK